MGDHKAESVLLDASDGMAGHDEFLSRIGHMTRTLHESLRGLGLDKLIEKAATEIPDARDRLDYVARLSEQAAQKVLNATDAAGPLQDQIDAGAATLAAAYSRALANPATSDAEWRALAGQAIGTMDQTQLATSATKTHLMDIMMAQDFQDLTGQVIGKVTTIAQKLETQLVQMLVDFAPEQVRRDYDNGLLNGPQINPEGHSDVVANQGQVDDLLDSLGF